MTPPSFRLALPLSLLLAWFLFGSSMAAEPTAGERMERKSPGLSTPALDFETDDWKGGIPETERVKRGGRALLWKNHPKTDQVTCDEITADWSAYGAIRFWMHSRTNNGARIVVRLPSRSASSPEAYFYRSFPVDWTGWKEVTLPFHSFLPSRSPAGWSRIDRLEFRAAGWNAVPQASSEWILDDVRLTGRPDPAQLNPPDAPPESRFLGNRHFAPGLVERMREAVSAHPVTLGPPPGDRKTWNALATNRRFAALLALADEEAGRPSPPVTADLFKEWAAGRKDGLNDALGRRIARLNAFCFGEALRGDGRHLPALEETVTAFLDQGSWADPVHLGNDPKQFDGALHNVDLVACHRAMMLALVVHWYETRLSPGLADRVRAEVKRRIWDPYLAALAEDRAGLGIFFWVTSEANWNPVCHSGVVGSALLLSPDPDFKAKMLACAETFLPMSRRGFFEDGYTPEGISYWNYGLSHYLLLSRLVERATDGKVVHHRGEKMDAIFDGGRNLAIAPGQFAAFGDAPVGATASPMLDWAIDSLRGVASPRIPREPVDGRFYPFLALLLESGFPTGDEDATVLAPRNFFEDAQIFVGRGGNPPGSGLGFAFKAGANSGSHHHVDNGSFTVASGGGTALADPGMDTYLYNQGPGFDPFSSQIRNSYGHPVPFPGRTLQKDGDEARAEVVSIVTNPSRDECTVDLTASYPLPALKSLLRTFRLDRNATNGILTVEDSFSFSSNLPFETALMSRAPGVPSPDGALFFGAGGERLRVTAEAEGGELDIRVEDRLKTFGRTGDVRTAFAFRNPTISGKVRLRIEPAPLPDEVLLPVRPPESGRIRPVALRAAPRLLSGRPERLFDGNLLETWGENGEPTLVLDFGRSCRFESLHLAHELRGLRRYRGEIEFSADGVTWTDRKSWTSKGTESGLLEALSFQPLVARFIRLTGKGNTQNIFNGWTEIDFLGAAIP